MADTERILKLDELMSGVQNVASHPDSSNIEKLAKISAIMQRATCIVKDSYSHVEVVTKDVDLVCNAAAFIGNEIGSVRKTIDNYEHKKFGNGLKKISRENYLSLFDASMLGLGYIPVSHSMFSTFNPENPVIKEKQKRQQRNSQKDPVGPETCPDSIDKAEQTEETSAILEKVKSKIMRIFKHNNMKPLKYFQIILDPSDFGKTIDNIFQVAFLVRDRTLELIEDDQGELWLKAIKKSETDELPLGDGKQVIMGIDLKHWQDLIKKYKVKTPMIDISDRYEGKR